MNKKYAKAAGFACSLCKVRGKENEKKNLSAFIVKGKYEEKKQKNFKIV